MNFSDTLWEKALAAVNTSSSCARLTVTQFKVLFRLHYSKDKPFRLFPDKTANICDRCSQTPCNLTHMFWACPKLTNYWQAFFKAISDILGIPVDPSPLIAIFAVGPDKLPATSRQDNVIALTSLIAHRKILYLWKFAQPPSFKILAI